MTATWGRRFTAGGSITSPVTVVFGSRDPLIRIRVTDLGRLPSQTKTVLRRGLGHVPTWDEPDFVASTIAATAGAWDARRWSTAERATARVDCR